jgi:hypothetical protein
VKKLYSRYASQKTDQTRGNNDWNGKMERHNLADMILHGSRPLATHFDEMSRMLCEIEGGRERKGGFISETD